MVIVGTAELMPAMRAKSRIPTEQSKKQKTFSARGAAMIAPPDSIRLARLLVEYSELPEFIELEALDTRTRGNFGNTPLHVAAARASSAEVDLLLQAGADINASGEHGYAALHDAVAQGALDVVLLLLARGANVWARNEFGETPRDLAKALGHQPIVEVLEEHDPGSSTTSRGHP